MGPRTNKVTTPFRFRNFDSQTLLTNEVGDYGFFNEDIIPKIFSSQLTEDDEARLDGLSINFDENKNWKLLSLAKRLNNKLDLAKKNLSYILVVPTLRCDLSCVYCQVSRAPVAAKGFDWDKEKVNQFSKYLDGLDTQRVKIEFQGGEVTLRPDLIKEIIRICESKFSQAEFVICTNLLTINKEIEEIYQKDNVFISTSIDGAEDVMDLNRTNDHEKSVKFFKNFEYITKKYGRNKVSALPTITEKMLNDPKCLIDFYISLGFDSIFLRPVNYMGFARKNFRELSKDIDRWNDFYREALDYIVEVNQDIYFEEYYFSLLLKNTVQISNSGYVDFRSPNFYLQDYCVIDFDGKIYPSDEARMLSRTNHVDLSLGELGGPINSKKVEELNWQSMNQTEADCLHCAYMPFCGTDLIDDMSRYNRIDFPKLDTWFCRRNMMVFDLIFEKIANKDLKWLDVFLKWIYRETNPPKTYEIFYDSAEI
jgi:His-Xaa-Ser system radical SAM maturase HxsB